MITDWNATYRSPSVFSSENENKKSEKIKYKKEDVERDDATVLDCVLPYGSRRVKVQSDITSEENLVATGESKADEIDQEVVKFLDENSGQTTGFSSVMDNVTLRDSTPVNSDLGDFLKRPVLISTFTWNETDGAGTKHSLLPWRLFFDDTRIKYKTNNYSFIQCDLKVKVLINASPFYYGAMIGAYQPLPFFSYIDTAGSFSGQAISYSQRPHMWIFPTANAGAEMTLPFFYNKNWLSLQKASDFDKMGQLDFINYTPLSSANGVTGTGVTVQVYAWAENVRIAGPSVGLAMQAKYEGPVSKPASAVAEAASALKKIPMIASFATATEMGARSLAAGAHALGYTNDPVVQDVSPLKPTSIAPLSTSEISYPVEKLSLDHKNELSIDPGIAGLNSTDELSICHLVQKESFLCTTTWDSAASVDTNLFTAAVGPAMYYTDSATNPRIYMTPMCWLSYNFAQWRGDIIFRFRFVASPYHKGRVRISYDPTGYSAKNVLNDPVSTTAVFTQIVDLGKDTDVEVRVPYQQALAWLRAPGFPTAASQLWNTSSSPTFNYDANLHNGTINMKILTNLTAPVSSSTVPIMVFVRGADNLEFANPVNAFAEQSSQYSWFKAQSKDESEEEANVQSIIAGGVVHTPAPERYLVNFGEAVLSLRQVLRRSSLSGVRQISNATSDIVLFKRTFSKYPLAPGYDPSGLDSATGIVATGSNFPYNFVEFHPMAYISAPFIGTRGSVIWHFNVEDTTQLGSIRCYRLPLVNSTPGESVVSTPLPSTRSAYAKFFQTNSYAGSSGQAVTNQFTQAGMSVSLPYYNNYKFSYAFPANASLATSTDGTGYDCAQLEIAMNGTSTPIQSTGARLWQYASIGTDYNLLFFLNVPTLYSYSSSPPAN